MQLWLICLLTQINYLEGFGSTPDDFSSAFGEPDLSVDNSWSDFDSLDHSASSFDHHNHQLDHELVSGSAEAAHEFASLDPELARKRLGQLVDKIDKDGNGKVSREELKQWIVNSFNNLDKESASKQMPDFDRDGDGSVTWQEYTNRVYGYNADELESLKKESGPETQPFLESVGEERVKFDSADQNADGRLDKTEFAAFQNPHNYRHMAPYEQIHTLRSFDKNGDGVIDQNEYLTAGSASADVVELEKANFRRYDKNSDGKLEGEELIDWITPGFDKQADDEVEHLFTHTNSSIKGGDELTKEEIVASHDLWVGSQATDYGHHLDAAFLHDEL